MVKGRPRWKKPSMYSMTGAGFLLDISSVYEWMYDFWSQHYRDEQAALRRRWDRLPEQKRQADYIADEFADENYRLDWLRREFGYAIAILTHSLVEKTLRGILGRIGVDDPLLAAHFEEDYEKRRGLSLVEKYTLFHRDKFHTDFWSDVPPLTKTLAGRGPLPEGMDTNFPAIDIGLLLGFVWARNRIVHHRGIGSYGEAKKRSVPVVPLHGELFEEDMSPGASRRSLSDQRVRIHANKEYLERVVSHAVAFFDRVIADLNAAYYKPC
jgi:hypothetical protein